MRMLRAGLAGIIIAAATLAMAKAQPYYPPYPGYGYPYPAYGRPYPAYGRPYPAYGRPYPAYGYPGYPAYWGSPPYYPWAPPAYPFPYAYFAPYSARVGPGVDNEMSGPLLGRLAGDGVLR
jgi:hypothetical protein